MQEQQAAPLPRLTYTIPEAAMVLGISTDLAYDEVERGTIPVIRLGRRILVPVAALERFVARAGGGKGESP